MVRGLSRALLRWAAVLVLVSMSVLGCAPGSVPSSPAGGSATGARGPESVPKTLTMAFQAFPSSPAGKLQGGGRGNVQFHWIFNAYLSGLDSVSKPQPMLAESVPSVENGTWKLNPDGSMETVWKIRSTALWHDGRPIVSKDFALAWEVINDPAMPVPRRAVESLMTGIETPDDRTVVIKWEHPYAEANAIYGDTLPPIPAHLVDDLYRRDKNAFVNSDYWTTQFIGSGPFKVEQWDPASNLILGLAHDGYALGRPKIDRLRIVYIAEEQSRVTNVLAGAVDAIVSPDITATGVSLLRENWEPQGKGRIAFSPGLVSVLAFQLRDLPSAQKALQNRAIRVALVHAMDRESIAGTMPPGLLTVAHYPIAMSDPFYPAIDRTVRKYDFNPEMAEGMLDAAGWRRGPDGIRQNASGERLDVPILTPEGEHERYMTIVADNWKRVGVDGRADSIPGARSRDGEFRAVFRGAHHEPHIPRWDGISWTADNIPSASNRWVGRNHGGYVNPEADALVERLRTTLDQGERTRAAVEAARIWAEDVGFVPILYQPDVIAAAKDVGGYDTELSAYQSAHTWNLYRWTKD